MTDRTPLLHYRLSSSITDADRLHHAPGTGGRDGSQLRGSSSRAQTPQPQKLSTFFGVVIPTLLSMFSVVVFLRIGFAVGQSGLYQTIAMFIVAYIIIGMTVLSVCAISTNGALDAGGAYYMISRALGPEFGGSIGIMFFLANVCGSALFVLGLVESIMDTFGVPQGSCCSETTASCGTSMPTFRYFTWHTCVLGIVGCGIMMFLINPIYASASIAFMLFLLVVIHYLSPTSSWGYISQALIFHQMCWLGRLSASSIFKALCFPADTLPSDPLQSRYDSWLTLVDKLNIKAFVNLTLADTIRHGVQQLLFISGLGTMQGPEEKLRQLLRELRIKADIHTVAWDSVVALHWHKQAGRKPEEELELELEEDFVNSFPSNATRMSDDYLQAINRMILQQASEPAVRFLYLPRPPADTSLYHTYLRHLDIMTKDLGPTLLIHGVTPVTSTHL
ncbi:solute carrier family 12 member 9-like [Acipenser oxyrinchus oxyrinchus]|uniref:Solute carrier family 12 member 9-like n=1 Tax=Acipenser oxyrinchus oxyrinchus TaxID=40147 RepID=A0AAD8D4K5_ACIOX|nr:solute carrier family 12 member 9-like [Acipenser oxyrinchus oxyrinchus]